MSRTLRNFSALNINGELVSLGDYQGSLVLIVNTASKCKLVSQLHEFQKLYENYKDLGFVILGFPCNQFMKMEPDDDFTIKITCLQQHGVTFPMFSKVDVIGEDAHVLFKWLQNELRGFPSRRILWNFTKFIIGRDGKPIKRFGPYVPTKIVQNYISKKIME